MSDRARIRVAVARACEEIGQIAAERTRVTELKDELSARALVLSGRVKGIRDACASYETSLDTLEAREVALGRDVAAATVEAGEIRDVIVGMEHRIARLKAEERAALAALEDRARAADQARVSALRAEDTIRRASYKLACEESPD